MAAPTVEEDLKAKRTEYKDRMEHVKKREQQLKEQRQNLQERLVQFYKYIQDNEIKRVRATKKANAEAEAKKEQHKKIELLNSDIVTLEAQKQHSNEQYLKYAKFERYLNDVLHHNEGDEYGEARDIIGRYRTLDENRNLLKKRQMQLERTRTESKVQLSVQQQRAKNEAVELQNAVNNAQHELDELQRLYKSKQRELETSVTNTADTTKTISQVRMACQNLFDRCMAVNQAFRGRVAREHDQGEDAMVAQLDVIGDCLDDYQWIIQEWKKKIAKGRADDSPMAGGGHGATAAGGTAKAAESSTAISSGVVPTAPASAPAGATRNNAKR